MKKPSLPYVKRAFLYVYVIDSTQIFMKQPQDCQNMQEIRTEIDAIDQEVIHLLGKRFGYVKAASRFKTSEDAVKAPDRFRALLLQRREWAIAAGLHPDAIEKMYFDLVTHFIEEEMKLWKK